MASITLPDAERTATSQVLGDPGAPATDGSPPAPEEQASIATTVARLRLAYPWIDAATVEATVQAAYDSFQGARVTSYIPILAERRSRKALGAASRTDGEGGDR
ncbi:three-helix bundle dimerization domain-containing protein [Streptomyces sp. NPDC054932]